MRVCKRKQLGVGGTRANRAIATGSSWGTPRWLLELRRIAQATEKADKDARAR